MAASITQTTAAPDPTPAPEPAGALPLGESEVLAGHYVHANLAGCDATLEVTDDGMAFVRLRPFNDAWQTLTVPSYELPALAALLADMSAEAVRRGWVPRLTHQALCARQLRDAGHPEG